MCIKMMFSFSKPLLPSTQCQFSVQVFRRFCICHRKQRNIRRFTRSFCDFHGQSEHFFSPENRNNVVQRLQKGGEDVMRHLKFATNDVKRRNAAVLVPLININGKPGILFTVRASHLSEHRGEVSFPGGVTDEKDDGSPIKTALRETHEEIGIDPGSVDVWGTMPIILSRDGKMEITPVVGVVSSPIDIGLFVQQRSAVSEVHSIFVRTFEFLCLKDNLSFTQFRIGYSIPIFMGDGRRIWGITAIILHHALRALVPDLYRPVLRFVRRVS